MIKVIQINKPIVGYSILTEEPKPDKPVLAIRDEVLTGATYKVKTPLSEHALYITINDCDGRPFEMFINSKAMDNFQWIVAMTRVVSAVFRQGGEVAFLVDELKSVFDPKGGYFKKGGVFMPSLVAEIGCVLETHLTGLGLIQKDDSMVQAARAMVKEKLEKAKPEHEPEDHSGFPDNAEVCLYCNVKASVLLDGCRTCLNCSASKCG